jgi:hypothetical protein
MNTENEIALIHEELQELNKKIDRIYNVLIGDEQMKIEGLVDKVAQHDRFIQKQKISQARIAGIATGMGILGGVLVEMIMKMFV